MKILIVDDSANDRAILRLTFHANGCETVEAENGREGLAVAAEQRPDLIISDALMPVLDGFGFLRELKADESLKAIPFIFYSAVYTGYEDEHLARSLGAVAFLVKPLEPAVLWQEIEALLARNNHAEALAPTLNEDAYLKEYSHVVVAKLQEKVLELENMLVQMVRTLVNLIDAKSPWTGGHSERVAELAVKIAREMALDENRVNTVRLGALLHDIGKIGTIDSLLDKKGSLTDAEYEILKGHPDRGADALEAIAQLKYVIPIIRYHHEHIDGSGYPYHLDQTAIPPGARIVAVADAYDSMTATRPYRAAPGIEAAIAEIKRGSGSQFDPEVVAALFRVLKSDTKQT